MKKGKGRGKERDAPTHLKRSHSGRFTKNKNGCDRGNVVSNHGRTIGAADGAPPIYIDQDED